MILIVSELTRKIYSKSADISKNRWILSQVIINNIENGLVTDTKENLEIFSTYDHKKLTVCLKIDTMSFLDLALNYNNLQKKGYNKAYLDKFK